EDVIEGMLEKRVDLPSGGYLLIEYAEAFTVVDVNTGSFTGRGKSARLEDTITKTNLEAAEEVVNQLRLRDIGGIIVIDFIDMARARNRDAVLKTLRKALDEDRTKTFVVEISPLGLVEMTRQNVTEGVREIMTKTCTTCGGEGVIRSEETVAIDVDRQLREHVKQSGDDGPAAFLVRINPRVTAQFIGENARMLHNLEADTGRFFSFEGSEGLPVDHFAVTLEGTRDEVMAAAIPFADGDEVHVTIVEPHMYEVDDAVAKVDGYIISVRGAGPFVGSKRLVRIEEAGRTAATATLIDLTPEEEERIAAEKAEAAKPKRRGRRGGRSAKPKAAAADDTETPQLDDEEIRASTGPAGTAESDGGEENDALDSTPRRRGRRGGRRRSRAKDADSTETSEQTEETNA
ncbi:MAG: ribonuclease, partial [Solirubrobacteraceae bacterium]|nr:ribonuclease [Solirubrobacteraceae bacterium]